MRKLVDDEMEAIERAIIRVQQRLLRRMAKGNLLNSDGHDHEAVAALADAAGYVKNMTWTMDMEVPMGMGAPGHASS